MKKLLCLICVFALFLTAAVSCGSKDNADKAGSDDKTDANIEKGEGWTFNKKEGKLSITVSGEMNNFYYVEDQDGTTSPWDGFRSQTKTLELSDQITSIGSYAFYGFDQLESVKIPGGIVSIGSYAFRNCVSLRTVSIADSVESIGRFAFDGTAWYDEQPDGIVYAGRTVIGFKGEPSAASNITLNEGTLSIAEWAFLDCREYLSSVYIPASVNVIMANAFGGCNVLSSVSYGGTPEQWAQIDIGPGNDTLTAAYSGG